METSSGYLSYLLRIWRTGQGCDKTWRASLESPSSGQRWDFPGLEQLWNFLQEQIKADSNKEIDHES